jgi:hypothetical protein
MSWDDGRFLLFTILPIASMLRERGGQFRKYSLEEVDVDKGRCNRQVRLKFQIISVDLNFSSKM